MGKAVLISIRPKWCELIASGKKTIEVRKTRPKLETPFKCYIYCTKPSYEHEDFIVIDAGTEQARAFYGGEKVIAEFVCDRIAEIHMTDEGYDFDVPKMTCLKYEEMEAYLGRKNGYGWHISDLVIYDRPKELNEFRLNRPPQSWCYVEPEAE